eukprot:NODE_27266_length_519_cov_3.247449.p3 GENE.NODE_27266_length_519_cov_3.247449~~NODE_27266_length_519_cov_3.247449.p3  ORF type:complete len:65 (+),score=5.92 NODE_27266_length_519_cov_3.247449:217-411(+)
MAPPPRWFAVQLRQVCLQPGLRAGAPGELVPRPLMGARVSESAFGFRRCWRTVRRNMDDCALEL